MWYLIHGYLTPNGIRSRYDAALVRKVVTKRTTFSTASISCAKRLE
jgi:hypothetical protein